MVTISTLRNALLSPEESFATIKNIRWDSTPIIRSTYFAETQIFIGSKQYLLAMPLTSVAMHCVERFCILKRHLKSGVVPALRIMRDEMSYVDAVGREHHCDILLEPMPDDMLPYGDAIANAQYDQAEADSLIAGLDKLEAELIRADVSLGNLRVENLCIDSNSMIRPIRWYHATNGAGGDKTSFKQLREQLSAHRGDMQMNDSMSKYFTCQMMERYLDFRTMAEGLIAVEDAEGWGFVDCQNHIIIKPRFDWVSDFCEGRAKVETKDGMGLINKMDNYVIQPRYEILNYDPISGQTRAFADGKWHTFNYSGDEIFDEQRPKKELITAEN